MLHLSRKICVEYIYTRSVSAIVKIPQCIDKCQSRAILVKIKCTVNTSNGIITTVILIGRFANFTHSCKCFIGERFCKNSAPLLIINSFCVVCLANTQ